MNAILRPLFIRAPPGEVKSRFFFLFLERNQNYAAQNEDDTEGEIPGERLAEYHQAYEYRREGLQCAEDSRGGASHPFGGIYHQHKRHDGGHDGKPFHIEPAGGRLGEGQRTLAS